MCSRSTSSLLGKGNHEAKYAGLNQGSQRILPCRVSINRPACPRNVISTNDPPLNGSNEPVVFAYLSIHPGRYAFLSNNETAGIFIFLVCAGQSQTACPYERS